MSYRACKGIIKTGALGGPATTNVGFITGYDYDEDATEIDSSVMGNCDGSSLAGRVNRPIVLDGYSRHLPSTDGESDQDAGQAALIPGTQVSLAILPNGEASGSPKLEWTDVTISGRRFAGVVDGIPTWNVRGTANVTPDETAQP